MDGLDLRDFSDPTTLAHLYEAGCGSLPQTHGVYVVVRPTADPPAFLKVSPAGWTKGRDPSYPLPFVESNWVPGAQILYVGKAESKRGLRQRVRSLVRFGFGHKSSHRGGRLLWHLADAKECQLRWRAVENAASVESVMIAAFRNAHGMNPFANLTE